MKKTRAVFVIRNVEREQYFGGSNKSEAETVTASPLMTVESHKIPDGEKFCKATPTGKLKFYCTNPALVGTFNPGDEFYVDMVPIEKG